MTNEPKVYVFFNPFAPKGKKKYLHKFASLTCVSKGKIVKQIIKKM